jgi:regulator of protease activity HflC (stomatin/prohibitin superfamily)
MKMPEVWDFDTTHEYNEAMTEYRKWKKSMSVKTVFGIGGSVVAGLVALTVLGGSWYTVDQGERGVILRNGAITGTAEPGLGFKMPIVDRVVDIDIRSQAQLYENVLAYSRDQQTAGLIVSVNYRIPADQVVNVYENFGSVESLRSRVLDRQVFDEVKNVFGQFNAVTAIQERSRLVAEVQAAIQEAVQGPIIIESVQIENIDFDDSYERAIAARMEAEVEVQRIRQNAEREKVTAEITVIQAQAAADAQLAQAKAQAEATRLAGEAEADAIRARGDALRENPNLVGLVQAERWNGQLPTTMVPGSSVPFMNVGDTQR